MKSIKIIISLILLLSFNCSSIINAQSKINRPSSSKPTPTPIAPKPKPTSEEDVNGFSVKWNGATASQKTAIKKLLSQMVYVQGGTFLMGSDNGNEDERPVHKESVSSFYIDKYEVTQSLWRSIMGNYPSYNQGDNLPVEKVSRYDCKEFINKLNKLTGLEFRLPTEAEWEYAARGGNRSKGYTYSGSDDLGSVGWFSDNSGGHTHPVGMLQPNELGIYDMSGNVMERTSDSYRDNYNSTDMTWFHVVRGGSFNINASGCRVASRSIEGPDYKSCYPYIGLRLAL